MAGGLEISELVIVTLPRESGADNAAAIMPTLDPSGASVVDVKYSISGQSAESLSRDSRATDEKLLRNGRGTFSNAISPLREDKGPVAFCISCI